MYPSINISLDFNGLFQAGGFFQEAAELFQGLGVVEAVDGALV